MVKFTKMNVLIHSIDHPFRSIAYFYSMTSEEWLSNLRLKLASDLPGEAAHSDMIPFRSLTSDLLKSADSYKESGVAVLLFLKDGVWHSVLIERPTYPGAHSGQMALPGGKRDADDPSLIHTAIREMHEEIGFYDPDLIWLGGLTKVFIPVSQFLVYPHVFFTKQTPEFIGDEFEVANVVPFQLGELLDDSRLIHTSIPSSPGVTMKNVPAFELEGKLVWGATCLILNELKWCLRDTGFSYLLHK
jgi:8-oxo-dGTP pyrophosphatase MutT (NUDIX family)